MIIWGINNGKLQGYGCVISPSLILRGYITYEYKLVPNHSATKSIVLAIRDILESGSSFSAWIRLFLFLVYRIIVSGGSGYGEFRLLQ